MTSTKVSVSVSVDPATAFTAFTEELDQWWVRGPINYFDAARYAHAQKAGATIIQDIAQVGYRACTAEDLEGNRWTFAQARPHQT